MRMPDIPAPMMMTRGCLAPFWFNVLIASVVLSIYINLRLLFFDREIKSLPLMIKNLIKLCVNTL